MRDTLLLPYIKTGKRKFLQIKNIEFGDWKINAFHLYASFFSNLFEDDNSAGVFKVGLILRRKHI